jgi:hypothetical protein
MSYGSYIFRWRSRYQLLFWPRTTSNVLYFCGKCHYAALLGDFEKLPESKRAAVAKAVAAVQKPQADLPYNEVPIAYRLTLAEAAYRVQDHDDEFWCGFHRMQGYHLAAAGLDAEALAVRRRALALAEKMLAASPALRPEKELRFLVGALRFFTGDRSGAKKELALAQVTPVVAGPGLSPRRAQGMNTYLDEVAKDLLQKLEAGEPPPEDK